MEHQAFKGRTRKKECREYEIVVARGLYFLLAARKNLGLKSRELQKMQNKRLRAIIKHAYENVPFYHRKFDAANIKPDDVKSVTDLVKVPLTAKSEIKTASTADVLSKNIDVERVSKRFTSGSTGVPLTIFLDKTASILEGTILKRTFLEDGLRVKDKMAILTDLSQNPEEGKSWIQRIGLMNKKYISIFEDVEKQVTFLKDYKPNVLRGYSSAVTAVAEHCRRNSVDFYPHLIFTGAEILNNEERKLINSVFRAELFDLYGSQEFGHMAWECEKHMGYHVNADAIVMEFLKEGESVGSGENGEIVCTNLINYAMPLIRYELEDVGAPIQEMCSCGRAFPLMKIVEGRKDDFLLSLDGEVVSPFNFFPYPFESGETIRQFRIIQERRDLLIIQLAVDDSFLKDREILPKARTEIRKMFGEGMEVEFQILDRIPREPSGKFRMVVSKLSSNAEDLQRHLIDHSIG